MKDESALLWDLVFELRTLERAYERTKDWNVLAEREKAKKQIDKLLDRHYREPLPASVPLPRLGPGEDDDEVQTALRFELWMSGGRDD